MTWFDLVKTMVPRDQLPRIDDFKPSSTKHLPGRFRPKPKRGDYRGRRRYKGLSYSNPKGFTRHDIPFFLTDDELKEYKDAKKVRHSITWDDESERNTPNSFMVNRITRNKAVETMTRLKELAKARWKHYYVEGNE
tara:strand:+ start:156 stop:563 length:408 start_codon:yes stop_codon:yes gene_type:complete